MQTAHSSNNLSSGSEKPVFPALTSGQKLAGCYLLGNQMHTSDSTSIWVAHDEVLGKDVALHFLPQAVRADEKAMDELRHQIKRNRQLIHPNILRIYDFIEDADWAAISTDAIDGESLAELRRKKSAGFFEVADVKPWLAQLCQTLDDAHKIQLVHGDLSPDHLFIDRAGRLVATDFGLGRCIRDAVWRASGQPGGTPPVENLSPQMLDAQTPSASDDIYATGVLLHELLAGAPPFTAPDIAAKIRNTVAGKVVERRSEMHKAGGPVPPHWEKAIASCLEKSPDQRPRTLSDLSTRLSLPKSEADEPEPRESAPVAEGKSEPIAAEPEALVPSEPEIPVVKKAWVGAGATKSAPVFSHTGQPATPAQPAAAKKNEELVFSRKIPASEASKPLDRDAKLENALDDGFPNAGKRRAGLPITGLAAAAILVAMCVYAVFFGGFRKPGQADPEPIVHTESRQEIPQYSPVKNPISEPVPESSIAESSFAKIEEAPVVKTPPIPEPPIVAAIVSKPTIEAAPLLAAAKQPPKSPAAATPIPAPAVSDQSNAPAVASKAAALEAARKSVEEWDKAHQAMLRKKEQAEAAIADARKELDEKMKAAGPMLKASDEVAALRQKREADRRAAELAAEEAKKAAEEKARLADEAKKAVENVDKENKDKLAGQRKVEAELEGIKKVIAENERVAAESAKLADGAMSKKAEQVATVKQKEQEVALAMAAAEIERQKRQEMDEKRDRIRKEMDEAKKLFEERMKALESSLKDPDPGVPPPNKAPVEKTPPEVKPAPPSPEAPKPSANGAPTLPSAESTLLAKMETPPVPKVETRPALPAGGPTANSLGMAFIPVGDVQFATWPTRVKDFETFATATGLKSNLWRDPGFKQGADHPVVNVTWMEASAFCKWLTFKEQHDGTLPAGKVYRLPTDLEWSKAVGLPDEGGKTAEARDMGVPDVYPWGTTWPPPAGAGNYTGEETGSDVAIKGYNDGFPWTSPVGSFPPNKYGLSDMGGNVWQWVVDPWNADSTSKVLRGASWYNGALKLSLLSSCRVHAAQDSSTDNYGFRCVIASESPKSVKR